MKVFSKLFKRLWIIPLLAVAIMMVPHPTEAGVKKIWPDKFIPLNNIQDSLQFPSGAASHSTSEAYFYANLELPVGAEIKKVVYFHRGSGLLPLTGVVLGRQKLGRPPDSYLLGGHSEDDSDNIIKVTTNLSNPTADLIVRKGYRYFLSIFSQHAASYICGIKVIYQ